MTEPISMINLEPYYSVLRSAGVFASGVLVTVGAMSPENSGDIVTGLDHIIAGSKEIMIGAGMLAGPVLTAWGFVSHRPKAVLTAAAALSVPERREAFNTIPDTAKIAVASSVPDVAHIVVRDSSSTAITAMANDPGRPKVVAEGVST